MKTSQNHPQVHHTTSNYVHPSSQNQSTSVYESKMRKNKIVSADPSIKGSRSSSIKHDMSRNDMHSTGTYVHSNSKKKKGISIISTKMKTEGNIDTESYSDYKKDYLGGHITSYANKLIKNKMSKENNGAKLKDKT